jgi:hypothetical protein
MDQVLPDAFGPQHLEDSGDTGNLGVRRRRHHPH